MSAPKYFIQPNTEIHQQSPSWVVCFWVLEEPRVGFKEDKLSVKQRIIVINDAISITTIDSKSDHIKQAAINLKLTDTPYDALLKPNDFVAIWMCRWEEEANQLVSTLMNHKGAVLNGFNSGLKHFGKIKAVSKSVSVTDSGQPSEVVNVQSNMFTELNLSVYVQRLFENFNAFSTQSDADNVNAKDMAFLRYLDPKEFDDFIKTPDGEPYKSPDEVILFLTKSFLGKGLNPAKDIQDETVGIPSNIGNRITIPVQVYRELLGRSASNLYIDNIYFYTGVQKYNAGTLTPNSPNFRPSNIREDTDQTSFRRSPRLKGGTILTTTSFENTSYYSLIRQYLNDVCNEMFTTMKYEPKTGIRPAITVRQIPFTTPFLNHVLFSEGSVRRGSSINTTSSNPNKNLDEFDSLSRRFQRAAESNNSVTEYKNLPRWVINKDLVKSVNVGMGSQSHFNFVQIIPNSIWASLFTNDEKEQKQAQLLGNNLSFLLGSMVFDEKDINKNGLRAFIKETQFENFISGNKFTIQTPFWAAMQADFLFNLHLKLSGRISVFGIQEPISVGDNFEYDGILYHIEAIEHMCQVFPTGNKKFMTVLTVSNGTSIKALESTKDFLEIYPTIGIPHTYDLFGQTELQEGSKQYKKKLKGE